MLTLQGVRGARLAVDRIFLDEAPALDRAALELPEVVIEHFGAAEDYQRAIRPAFDALWNSAGYFQSRHFDANGHWVGSRR